MADFTNRYPYTDFHELNLDWFLDEFKKVTVKVDDLDTTVQQFTEFVTNYFDNLDVQQEINNKLNQMADDGTLAALIQPLIVDITNDQTERIAVLETRMDSFVHLAEGSTTGDAELIDGRIDASGETFDTIGDAIRAQVTGLKTELCNSEENGTSTFYAMGSFRSYGINLDGTFMTAVRYRVTSEVKQVFDHDIYVECDVGWRYGWVAFDGVNPNGTWLGWYTTRKRIPANQIFIMQIARDPDNTSEIADVNEYLSHVRFTTLAGLTADAIKTTETDEFGMHIDYTFDPGLVQVDPSYTSQYIAANYTWLPVVENSRIEVDSGYRFKLFWLGDDGSYQHATNNWLTKPYIFSGMGGYLKMCVSSTSPGTAISLDDLMSHVRICVPNGTANSFAWNLLKENRSATYKYSGERIDTRQGCFSVSPTVAKPLVASNTGIGSAYAFQGCAYDEGVVFQGYSDNGLELIDYADGTIIANFTTDTEHTNSIGFLKEKYDPSDEFHMAIIADGMSNRCRKARITRSSYTSLQTIVFPVATAGYYISTMVDALNDELYTIGYTENSYTSDPYGTNRMIFCRWNLNNMTDNGDSTYTPELLESFTTPFIYVLQGPCFYNGKLFVISSASLSTDTIMYVIDPVAKRICNVMTSFPGGIKTRETEAIYFFTRNGEDMAIVKTALDYPYYVLKFR